MIPAHDDTLVPLVWYVGFYPRRRSLAGMWGHCDMWGMTRDHTFVFLDPARSGFQVQVTHKAEEIDFLWALRLEAAHSMLRIDAPRVLHRLPFLGPLSCASICGHVLGVRAWTPRSLRAKLLANGAQEVEIDAIPV